MHFLVEFPGSCVPSAEAAQSRASPVLSPSRLPQGNQREMPKLTCEAERGVISQLQGSHPGFQQLRSWLLVQVLIRKCLLSLHASVTMVGSLIFNALESQRSSASLHPLFYVAIHITLSLTKPTS